MQHGRQGYGGKTDTLLSGWSRDELLEHFQRVVMEDIAAAGMFETFTPKMYNVDQCGLSMVLPA